MWKKPLKIWGARVDSGCCRWQYRHFGHFFAGTYFRSKTTGISKSSRPVIFFRRFESRLTLGKKLSVFWFLGWGGRAPGAFFKIFLGFQNVRLRPGLHHLRTFAQGRAGGRGKTVHHFHDPFSQHSFFLFDKPVSDWNKKSHVSTTRGILN